MAEDKGMVRGVNMGDSKKSVSMIELALVSWPPVGFVLVSFICSY